MFTIPYKDVMFVLNKYGTITSRNEDIIVESLRNIFGLYLRNQIVAYYDDHPELTYIHYIFQYDIWGKLQTKILKASFSLEAYYLILMNDWHMMRGLYQTEFEDLSDRYLIKTDGSTDNDDDKNFVINIEPLIENYLCNTDGFTFSKFDEYYIL